MICINDEKKVLKAVKKKILLRGVEPLSRGSEPRMITATLQENAGAFQESVLLLVKSF